MTDFWKYNFVISIMVLFVMIVYLLIYTLIYAIRNRDYEILGLYLLTTWIFVSFIFTKVN